MRKFVSGILALVLAIALSGTARAGTWDSKCTACHKDGNTLKAPTKAELIAKHKSADAFVKAAMASKAPMMKAMQKEDVLKEAAKDLYK